MDFQSKDRRKKSDKAKEKYEKYGAHTQRHVRMQEALAEKNAANNKKMTDKKEKNRM